MKIIFLESIKKVNVRTKNELLHYSYTNKLHIPCPRYLIYQNKDVFTRIKKKIKLVCVCVCVCTCACVYVHMCTHVRM